MAMTQLNDIINPQVMGDAIEAKLPHMLRFTPFAKVDNSLVGVPGDTKTIPAWNFVGAAEDLAEGGELTPRKMTSSTTDVKIKCAGVSIGLTQKAINSGHGDPLGNAETQLAKSVALKVDADVLAALLTATQTYDGSASAIKYAGIVDAVDVFAEEEITDKILFVNPRQVTSLRKDADFMDRNKYGNEVMVSGEIGMIAGCRVVPSNQVVKNESGNYVCPIVKIEPASRDTEYAEDELPAVTILLKADTQVDHEWFPKKQVHDLTAAKYYGVGLTNASKVVLATFKG